MRASKGIRPDRIGLRPEPVQVRCVKCDKVLVTIPQNDKQDAIACKECGIIFDRLSGRVLFKNCTVLTKKGK